MLADFLLAGTFLAGARRCFARCRRRGAAVAAPPSPRLLPQGPTEEAVEDQPLRPEGGSSPLQREEEEESYCEGRRQGRVEAREEEEESYCEGRRQGRVEA